MFANAILHNYLCPVVKKLSLPILVLATIVSLLWLPYLFAKGMFMDGVYNAMFAHNLLLGINPFWAPQTVYYSTPAYWDNPPLSMYLLSLAYKIMGDVYYVERIYSLLCAMVQLVLIAAVWKIFFGENAELKKNAWLPCLLFLISPLTGWCYSNNLMENTMSIFTTASVIVFVLWLRRGKYIIPFAFAGGGLIVLAAVTKGPVGLFPLALPLFFVFEKSKSRIQLAAYLVIQLMAFTSVFYAVFSTAPAADFLEHYLQLQLLPALQKGAEKTHMQFVILYELLRGLLPLLVAAIVSFFFFRSKNKKENTVHFSTALPFIMIGFSASLPILLSNRQHHYYLLPSLPLFAIGFAIVVLPSAKWLLSKIESVWNGQLQSAIQIICVALIGLAGFLSVNNIGTYVRDENLLKDIEAIQPIVKGEKLLNTDSGFFHEWPLRGYLKRNYDQKICMPHEKAPTNFYLTEPGSRSTNLPEAAQKVYGGKTFDLYQAPL